MQVTQATKDAFLTEEKHLYMYINNGTNYYSEELIVADSMSLKENLSLTNIEISGCIPNTFQIEVLMTSRSSERINIGDKIDVYIQAGNSEIIPLFKGRAYEIVATDSVGHFKVTAYDSLYSANLNKDWSMLGGAWYNALVHEQDITAKGLLSETFKLGGINVDEDWFEQLQQRSVLSQFYLNDNELHQPIEEIPSDWTYLKTIKSFCELQGLIGIINREGKFEFISIKDVHSYDAKNNPVQVPYYKKCKTILDYEGITESKLRIAQMDFYSDRGDLFTSVEYDDVHGTNPSVQGNYFLRGTDVVIGMDKYAFNTKSFLDTVNYEITCPGMPWVEVGKDRLLFNAYNYKSSLTEYNVPVYNRTLRGIQNLTDTFDINIDRPDRTYGNVNVAKSIQNIQADLQTKPSAQYVTAVPESFASNTIYFVRKS